MMMMVSTRLIDQSGDGILQIAGKVAGRRYSTTAQHR